MFRKLTWIFSFNMRDKLFFVLMAVLILGLGPGVHAANRTVNNTADNASTTGCTEASFIQREASPFCVGKSPRFVAVGDFNLDLDEKPDLATANAGVSPQPPAGPPANLPSVTVLLGDGLLDFTESPDSPFDVNGIPLSVAVGDFNRDGNPDLATANIEPDVVAVLLGNGSGGFSPAPGSPFPVADFPHANPVSVAVGDFNRDDILDLATADRGPEGTQAPPRGPR